MISTDTLHKKFKTCAGASTDSRSIAPGSMFFALKGPNFDANTLAVEALSKGARFAVVDDPIVVQDDRFLLVPDVLTAIQDLAKYHRRNFNLPVIAITGSNGKTTTKELVHAVLASDRHTLATSGNLNNHIGVPLTLLRLTAEHEIAIIEMGANKPGDIAELAAVAEPTHGLITNIGKAHLEGFGNFDGVVRTKTELYQFIRGKEGLLFVNAEDKLLMEKSAGMNRVTYGYTPLCNTTGRSSGSGPFLELIFQGRGNIDHTVKTHLIGDYNLPNALAAIAIGQYFKIPDKRIAQALSEYRPGNNRSQFIDTGRNRLIMDAYNANPSSMAAALENFAAMASKEPKLAILGDMLELGAATEMEHLAIIDLTQRLGIDTRMVGGSFKSAAAGAGPACFETTEDLLAALKAEPIQGRLILLKGSRGIKLETVVPEL
ncbi:MAG: UDP-N-acetylmuramoyl-tripeptide--D-alanyl-D-alanine ligase [Flavobacteriales bacterium]|nr:UDP-N-acetylmuramoyl-tripeptide--D-alanyl-D-alanine ligase [Flavobacteriales bacterium]